jgi:hypothetical protein
MMLMKPWKELSEDKKEEHRSRARKRYATRNEVKKEADRNAWKKEYKAKKESDPKLKEKQAKYRENAKGKGWQRTHYLKKTYGMTVKEYDAMFIAQGNACAICKSVNPSAKVGWHIDHDHSTGKVRGILCRFCNIMLGNARDNAELMLLAVSYLKLHKGGE